MTGANFQRWFEVIYNESDVARGIATSLAGTAGLTTYLWRGDGVVAAFVTIIVFPVAKILGSAIHSRWKQSQSPMKELFETLGSEEKAVVRGFVSHGGSVMTWSEVNGSNSVSSAGIESLIARDLMRSDVMADGMRETFVLDSQLFSYAQKVLPDEPIDDSDDIPF